MLVEKLLKHPKIVIVTALVITLVLGFFIKDVDIDNSTRLFFPQKDPSYQTLLETEDTYGSMSVLGVSISTYRGSIINADSIGVIKNITDRILEMKDVEDVDSLTHIDYVCENDGGISATQLIPEDYTGSADDIAQLQGRLNEWSGMYTRVILNDDQSATQMMIRFTQLSDAEIAEAGVMDSVRKDKAINQIKEIIEEEIKGHHLMYRVYGDDVITQNSRAFVLSDLLLLVPVVILVVLLSLFFSFKTMDGTLLPLITVVMSAIQTIGLMTLLGFKFTIVSSVIPVALIAVGSAYGIHVLNHYYVEMEKLGKNFSKEAYKKAVIEGVKEVKLAVMLSGLTTVVGFLSLVTSPLVPLFSFSIFTAVGVAISLILSLFFIPSLLILKSEKSLEKDANRKTKVEMTMQKHFKAINSNSTNTMYGFYHFFCGSKPRILIFSILIIALSLTGLHLLKVETSLTEYFPKNSKLNQDIDYVDKEFAGSYTLDLLVRGNEKGDICNVEILKAVDDMERYLKAENPEIGKIVSFVTMLKRINAVWHVPVTDDYSVMTSEDPFFENNEANGLSDGLKGELGSDLDSVSGEDQSGDFSSDWDADFSSDWSGDFDSTFDSGFGEDWGDFDSDNESAVAEKSDWVDPNIRYANMLKEEISMKELLDIAHRAYINAGGSTATLNNIVSEVERIFNYKGYSYYEIPYDPDKYPVATREELRGVVENYLTLLSGSLGQFLDDEMNPKEMKVQVQLKSHSSAITEKIIKSAHEFADENFPEGYTLVATGTAEMERKMTELIFNSQITSLALSIFSVFVIITISFHSPIAGIIGAIPLILTIFLNYMVMGFAGIKLDLITSIIASLAVGVGIDYTIHFLSTYKEERALTDNLEEVTRQTFRKSGSGIITNAIAVGLGFLVLCLSKFVVLKYIGLLVGMVMFTSATLALTIVPGILNNLKPKFMMPAAERKARNKKEDNNK